MDHCIPTGYMLILRLFTDGMKFPDLIHAVKPEPATEIPQGQSAHDSFWDFISLMEESTHMIAWQLSDRTIPRSFRHMQGFGVNSFILVNGEGKRTYVKFHFTPHLGTHCTYLRHRCSVKGLTDRISPRQPWSGMSVSR